MKILLDESLPRKLKIDFGNEHEVWTVRDKKWLGIKNGELLKLLVAERIDIFVTVDRNLQYQQHLEKLPLTIFILCAINNRRETLKLLVPKLLARLNEGNLQPVIEVV